MIVQCGQCSTKFRLDDAKLKDAGTKVRCSKCRQVFMVYPDKPREESTFGRMVDEFGATGDQEAAQRLETPPPFPAGEPESAGSPHAEDTSTFQAENEATTPHVHAPRDEFDFGFDTADSAPQSEREPVAEEEKEADSWFEAPKGDAAVSADAAEDAGLSADGSFPPEAPEFQFEETEENGDLKGARAELSHSLPVEPLFAPDRGDAVDLEISRGTTPSEDSSEEADGGGAAARESESDQPGWMQASATDETGPEVSALPVAATRRRSPTLFPIIVTAISIVFVVLLAGGGLYFMSEGPDAFNRMGLGFVAQWAGLDAVDDGKITTRSTSAEFLKNREAGEIFVVRGEALNGYRKPRASIQVRALVYGPNGDVLARKTAYCGNSLTKEQLTTLPLEKLESAMNNQFGDSLSNLGTPAGKTIPFVVVFSHLPQEATEYGVEVAGSTVASQ